MRALTWNQLCYHDIAAKRVNHNTTLEGGLPRNKLCYADIASTCVKHNTKRLRALPRKQLCYTDIASKLVKRKAKAECGCSGGTNFVTRASPQSV